MIRLPPRSTRTDTLFPYTTLFRSLAGTVVEHRLQAQPGDAGIVAQHLVDDVVPHRNDLAGLDPGLQLVLHDLLRAQGVAAMHEVDLARDVGQGSEERRVGKACVSTCRSRWAPYN